MPKFQIGVLIKCEKTIKIFIKNLNQGKDFIIKDLDDFHILVKETSLSYIQEEVFKMQDENAYTPIEILKI
jgi:hypothetical protein